MNSKEATDFRIWATKTLKEYIKKGFVLNDNHLIKEEAIEKGFKLAHEVEETDTYFTDKDKEFVRTRTCLRIRRIDSNYMELTYKAKSSQDTERYGKKEVNIQIKPTDYEDLVTVSAQNVSNIDMNQTNNIIQETETLINEYNDEIEIIYPVKILDFSKDYYDKATYINSLEEENPIKAGLIISNNLHGELLAGWANTFANIQINKYIDEYIANNPVTVKYSTTDFTNKNVTATLETNAEIQVTNNSNSKEHTFEENGSFTFEYTIKGRQFKITATVDNIDKEKPTITGIKNGRVYTHSVTPIITDKNLQKIELTFNGQVVKGYQSNIQLIDEGYYVITATDKAGNSTRVGFQILINQNKDYQIEGNIIKNITNSTTRAEFEKQLGFITKFTITRNGKEISEDSIIATGDVLTTEAGDSYTLIVTGDVNRDGRVTIHDIIKIRIYLVLKNNLDEIELIAADSNLDGDKIGISDLIRVRILVLMGDLTH